MSTRTRSLRELEKLREHRQQRALRELQQARDARDQAQALLDEKQKAQRAIEEDISTTLRRPFDAAATGQVAMVDIHRSRRRVELLKEELARAITQTQQAHAALLDKTALHQDALRRHLQAQTRHDAVQEQRLRSHKSDVATVERRQLEEAQELGQRRAAALHP
jgi:hypothetical protein